MIAKSLLLLAPDRPTGLVWREGLEEDGYSVTLARNPYEALRLVQTLQPLFALTTADSRGMSFLRSTSFTNPGLTGIAVAASGGEMSPVDLTSEAWPTNLSALLMNGNMTDLLEALQKIRREPACLTQYMSPGESKLSLWHREVRRSCERDEALEWLEQIGSGEAGLNRKTIRRLLDVGDEMITNGLYNAPADSQGKPKYRGLSRPQAIELNQEEAIRLTLAMNDREVAIAASDPFGSLSPEVAFRHLLPALHNRRNTPKREGGGGAGLGFFKMFRAVSRLVINIEPAIRTEVIGFLPRGQDRRDNSGRERSLQIFVKEASKCRTE